MAPTEESTLGDVDFEDVESVDRYEATFTGSVDDDEITLSYTLESAVAADESATVYAPGDDDLEDVLVQPETYEFETGDREEVRFTATDDAGDDLLMVYTFAEAESADANRVT